MERSKSYTSIQGRRAGQKDNYRPISVLSVISKLLGKHVAVSFMYNLKTNGLFYDLQSGFHEGHSIETALIKLTDQILFDLD
jgi:hypothetical protein